MRFPVSGLTYKDLESCYSYFVRKELTWKWATYLRFFPQVYYFNLEIYNHFIGVWWIYRDLHMFSVDKLMRLILDWWENWDHGVSSHLENWRDSCTQRIWLIGQSSPGAEAHCWSLCCLPPCHLGCSVTIEGYSWKNLKPQTLFKESLRKSRTRETKTDIRGKSSLCHSQLQQIVNVA